MNVFHYIYFPPTKEDNRYFNISANTPEAANHQHHPPRGSIIPSSVPLTVTLHKALSKLGSSRNKQPALPFAVLTTPAPTIFPGTLSTPSKMLQRSPATILRAFSRSMDPMDVKTSCFSWGSPEPICFHRLKKSSGEGRGAGAINLFKTTGSLSRIVCKDPAI